MGVAGCGKSSLGAALAVAEALPLIEGDDFHSPDNRRKMAEGSPLERLCAAASRWLRDAPPRPEAAA